MEVSGQLHALVTFLPGERAPSTQWTGGWWAPEPVWMLWSRGESAVSAGKEASPACRHFLYQLNYPRFSINDAVNLL
jgi:hypothetical protein